MAKYVKTGEASKILGFSANTLLRWHRTEELMADYVSDGGTLWYDIERVQSEIERRRPRSKKDRG
jgi:hypothetical protein